MTKVGGVVAVALVAGSVGLLAAFASGGAAPGAETTPTASTKLS